MLEYHSQLKYQDSNCPQNTTETTAHISFLSYWVILELKHRIGIVSTDTTRI